MKRKKLSVPLSINVRYKATKLEIRTVSITHHIANQPRVISSFLRIRKKRSLLRSITTNMMAVTIDMLNENSCTPGVSPVCIRETRCDGSYRRTLRRKNAGRPKT